MTLTEARRRFQLLRADRSRIIVRPHAWLDHPDRGFTRVEIQDLVQRASGTLHENRTAATATTGSYLFRCVDDQERRCEMALLFERVPETGQVLVVIRAFRRLKA